VKINGAARALSTTFATTFAVVALAVVVLAVVALAVAVARDLVTMRLEEASSTS
jgi:hypothetical protein